MKTPAMFTLAALGLALGCGSTDEDSASAGGTGGLDLDSGTDAGAGGVGGVDAGGKESGGVPAKAFTVRIGSSVGEVRSPLCAVDGLGSVIVTGSFAGNIDLGGGQLPSVATEMNAFVLKLDASGAHQWSRQLGSTKTVTVTGLAANAKGEVALGGIFDGTIDLGVGPLTSVGKSFFVARVSAAGTPLWNRAAFNDVGISDVAAVAIDSTGGAYVAGRFNGNVDFGQPLASSGTTDGYLVKLDNAGNVAWQRALGGDGAVDWVRDVAVDGADNVYVTGAFSGTSDFGAGPIDSAGPRGVYVVKYDAAGKHMYQRILTDASGVDGAYLSPLGQDRMLIGGSYFGSVTLASSHTAQGKHDAFVLALDSAGAPQFSRSYGGVNADLLTGLTNTPDGKSFYAGGIYDSESNLLGQLPSGGPLSGFLLRLTENEVGQSQQGFAGPSLAVQLTSVASSHDGYPILAGEFAGQGLELGNNLLSATGVEVFVAKLVTNL